MIDSQDTLTSAVSTRFTSDDSQASVSSFSSDSDPDSDFFVSTGHGCALTIAADFDFEQAPIEGSFRLWFRLRHD